MVLPAMLGILSIGDLAGHESDDIPAQNGDGLAVGGDHSVAAHDAEVRGVILDRLGARRQIGEACPRRRVRPRAQRNPRLPGLLMALGAIAFAPALAIFARHADRSLGGRKSLND